MQSDPSRIPSVACLLYLAADQLVPRGMSAKMLKATKVPCRPVWVHPIRLSATITAATFLSLRDAGSLKLHLQDVTSKGPDWLPPGRLRTHPTLTVTEADTTPQEGLAGELLAIARDAPNGLLGDFQANGRLVADGGLPYGVFAYPFVRTLIRTELLDAGYYRRSQRFRVQPDCERIATLEQARTATVRWWEQRQATEPRLCAALVAVCRRASIPSTTDGLG
jgi:hypothetical protein